jgi:hypothetical protein
VTTQYELCMSLIEQLHEAEEVLREMRWTKQLTAKPAKDKSDDEKLEDARYQNEINALQIEVDRLTRIASVERHMLQVEANHVDLMQIVVSERTREAQLALQAKLDAMYDNTDPDAL